MAEKRIFKNNPKINSYGQYTVTDVGEKLGIISELQNKFLVSDLYTTVEPNIVNEKILVDNYELQKPTELIIDMINIKNSPVSGEIKSNSVNIALVDETALDMEDGNCEEITTEYADDGTQTTTTTSIACMDTYQYWEDLAKSSSRIYYKKWSQQDEGWGPGAVIADDIILTDFAKKGTGADSTVKYNSAFNSSADASYSTESISLSETSWNDIQPDSDDAFYIIVWSHGHKDLWAGTDKRDARVQVYKFPKWKFKFELDASDTLIECEYSEDAIDLNCQQDGASASGGYLLTSEKTTIVQGVADITMQGNEGGGYGAEAPAFLCNNCTLSIIPPFDIEDINMIDVASELTGQVDFPKQLFQSDYTEFFHLNPTRLINYNSLTGIDAVDDIYDFRPISEITIKNTSEYDLQTYYSNDIDKYMTSSPNSVELSFSIAEFSLGENITYYADSTNTPTGDIKYAFFVLNWDDEINSIKTWDDILDSWPTSTSKLLSLQDNNTFILSTPSGWTADGAFITNTSLTHNYQSPGIKTIKSVMFSYGANADGTKLQALRWKFITTRIFLGNNKAILEDFSDLGGADFTVIPWPETSPIISGISKESKYYESVENTLFKNKFLETDVLGESIVFNALNNDETGDYIGDIDLEQVRFFSTGSYDMSVLLQIENEIAPDGTNFYPYTNKQYWDGETNTFPLKNSVGEIFINDIDDFELKMNCVLEFNLGDVEDTFIIDSSGNGNKGILIGDYSINKTSDHIPLARDSAMTLPITGEEDKAI